MSADSVVDLVRQGIVPFEGGLVVRLGDSIAAASAALGFDPEKPQKKWYETDGTVGHWWNLQRGFLWWGPGLVPVELRFLDDRLIHVSGPDDQWKSSGTSWDDFNQDIEIENYHRSRAFLDAKLGKPTKTHQIGNTLLVAKWPLADAILILCWESRTPSLSVTVRRPSPQLDID
jgi:hypothetical protein